MTELDQASLLKRFEPVLKFTQGERFFPYHVDAYVAKANLWVKASKKPAEELLSEDQLDLGKLGDVRLEGANTIHYLQFISPVNLAEMAEFRINELREAVRNRDFHPTRSRLARVGYLARLLDVMFSLFLFLRGRVPGDSMAAALITFNKMLSNNRSFKYYGRVIQQSGWTVLQYWYFYPFNNWRTGFYGANDHEADWEMVNIYCHQIEDGEFQPAWVGYACHNFSGDNLRRHWDDSELEKVGEHPVVYVGGGSHASYFQRGEYLTQLSLPFFKPFRNSISWLDKRFAELFKENRSDEMAGQPSQVLTIPFVDYALGDGLSIGPGCDETWAQPGVIEPPPDWVMNYRGLWGYYAQDPFSGEDAPAGPRYNRDGTVRRAWFDPLGWAGMEKVVPPSERAAMVGIRKNTILSDIQALEQEIEWIQGVHYQRGIDFAAIQDLPHLHDEALAISKALEEERQVLAEKRQQRTVKFTVLDAIETHYAKDGINKEHLLRDHIHHAHRPQIIKNLRFSGVAEIWAAISIGMMMIAVVLLIVFARQFLLVGLGAMMLAMVTIEAAFKRRLSALVRWIAIVLAVGAFLILMYEFFWIFLLAIVMFTGFYMIVSNLRELGVRRRHPD